MRLSNYNTNTTGQNQRLLLRSRQVVRGMNPGFVAQTTTEATLIFPIWTQHIKHVTENRKDPNVIGRNEIGLTTTIPGYSFVFCIRLHQRSYLTIFGLGWLDAIVVCIVCCIVGY